MTKKELEKENKPTRATLRLDRKYPVIRIYYEDNSCKTITKRCSPEAAKDLVEKINDRIALGTFDLADFSKIVRKRIKLEKFAQDYLTYREREVELGNLSKATLETDYYALLSFLKFVGKKFFIDRIDDNLIKEYQKHLLKEDGKKEFTVNTYHKHLKSAFSYALEKNYIQANYFKKVSILQTKIVKRIHTDEEINLIRDELSNQLQRWKLDTFNLSLWTGARRGELFKLKKEDLVFIKVQSQSFPFLQLHGKGSNIRNIPLGPKAFDLINERIKILSDADKIRELVRLGNHSCFPYYYKRAENGYLFFEINRDDSISKSFKKTLKKLGIESKFHNNRKSYGSYLLEGGATLESVQKSLGHSSVETTETHYTEITNLKLMNEIGFIEEK